MNCETCNYKKSKERLCKSVIEIKPDCGYLFLINTEEYDIEDAILWFEKIQEIFPDNPIALIPANMIQSAETTLN